MNLLGNSAPSGKRTKIFSLVAICLAVLSTLGRLFCLIFFYDRIGYFKTGAALPVLFDLLYALSIVFFAISAVLFKPIAPSKSLSTHARLAAILPVVAFIPYIINGISEILAFPNGKTPLSDILSLIFAVIAVAYFASLALCKQPSSVSAIPGVGSIVWIVLAWMSSYLDFFVPMNSPDKLFFHFACIGAMFLIFSDVRVISDMPRPRFYYFSFFTGLLTLSTSSIPSIIANAKGIFASYSLLYEDIVLAAIMIYGVVRLLTQVWAKQEHTVGQDVNVNDQ